MIALDVPSTMATSVTQALLGFGPSTKLMAGAACVTIKKSHIAELNVIHHVANHDTDLRGNLQSLLACVPRCRLGIVRSWELDVL